MIRPAESKLHDLSLAAPSAAGRENSIGFIRLGCSLAVIFSHSFVYGGYDLGRWELTALTNNQVGLGRLAVDIFFLLSGFLISHSYLRLASLKQFLWHRFLRIYPAYWVCLILSALVIAPLLGGQISPAYLLRNLSLLVGVTEHIPGLFENNPVPGIVNGSLWTLPWEIRAYLLVAILGVAGLLTRKAVIWVCFLALWGAFVYKIFTSSGIDSSAPISSGARLLTFFFAGILFRLYRAQLQLNGKVAWLAILLLVTAILFGNLWVPYAAGLFYAVAPLPLGYLILYLAENLGVSRINSEQDISYGLYIYGTLSLNVIAHLKITSSWPVFLLLGLFVTLPLAWLSWHLIEKPALGLKNRWFGAIAPKSKTPVT